MIPLEIERYIEDRTGWLIEKTVEFIRKPSISGSEGEAAGLLAGTLEDSGLPASIDAAGNVVAVLEGPGTAHPQGKTLVLNVHLDTVPAGNPSSWRHDPFSGAIEDGRIYGRGACDTKGAWAPMVLAMEAIRQSGAKLQGQVIFSAVVMEELTCSVGMRTLLDRTLIDNRPDYIILGEPTGLNIAIGHKGRTELAVSTGGRSCHASTPWEGDNAIYKAGRAITSIERLAGEINSGPGDEVFGKTSLAMTDIVCNPGVRNVIPDSCTMYLDYRFPPGETPDTVLGRIHNALKSGEADGEARICDETSVTYTGMHCSEKKYMAGFTLDEDHPLVLAASRAVSSELGRKPLIYRWNFATDGGYSMTALGIPTIGFSPCEEHLAHVVNEYVRIDYMIEAAKAYAALIIELAG